MCMVSPPDRILTIFFQQKNKIIKRRKGSSGMLVNIVTDWD